MPRPDLGNPLLAEVTRLGEEVEQQRGVAAQRGLASKLQGAAAGLSSFFSQVKQDAQVASQALLSGTMDLGQFRQHLFAKYSTHDPRWVEAGVEYTKYFVLQHGDVPYVRYARLDDFVIEDEARLPANARVALLADWGTGQPEAFNLLRQIAAWQPHVLIHLGDIYYSGTEPEMRQAFYEPCQQILQPATTGCAIFNLCGNHDVYSGGQAYYRLLALLGQPASYFCLRNKYWQFLALDTGLHSRDLFDTNSTHLEPSEVEWVQDKVARAGRRKSILLSHHQPFSAYEAIKGQAINPDLLGVLAPVLGQVNTWFWGHEHNFVVYQPYQGIRGRCIGHGAIPVAYPDETPQLRFGDVPRVEVALGNRAGFYNHGYALLTLDGPNGHVAYYQDSSPNQPLYEEDI
jgi:hypothetical protein